MFLFGEYASGEAMRPPCTRAPAPGRLGGAAGKFPVRRELEFEFGIDTTRSEPPARY
jgi:hypothetical protein